MNEYSFQFDKYKIGKNLTAGLKLGASFRMPDELNGWNWAYLPLRLLYLDFDGMLMQLFKNQTHYQNSYYKVSGGVMFGDAIVEGIFDKDQAKSLKDGLNLPLPSGFALTREYNVFEYVNCLFPIFNFRLCHPCAFPLLEGKQESPLLIYNHKCRPRKEPAPNRQSGKPFNILM